MYQCTISYEIQPDAPLDDSDEIYIRNIRSMQYFGPCSARPLVRYFQRVACVSCETLVFGIYVMERKTDTQATLFPYTCVTETQQGAKSKHPLFGFDSRIRKFF
jgi:hypothetical protein